MKEVYILGSTACSITNNTIIAKGKTVIESSNPPIRSVITMSSVEDRKNTGIYHT